jgi:RNA polymerase sigma-70 factor, ECF subfamily
MARRPRLRARLRGAQDTRELGFPATLAAAGRGEHWALTELFRAYQPPLLRYLRAQEPSVADDLASEVWVAVARRMRRFVGDEAGFRSWLFTIGRCRLIEHRRKAARRRTDPMPHDLLDAAITRGLDGDPAVRVLEHLGTREAISALTAELSPEQAEAVLLRVVAGLDVAEVARIMDRSPGSVRVLCHRALRRLADRYEGDDDRVDGHGDGQRGNGQREDGQEVGREDRRDEPEQQGVMAE